MNRHPRRWAAAALFFFAAPLTLRAQTAASAAAPSDSAVTVAAAAPTAAAPAADAPAVAVGPTLANAAVGVRAGAERPVVVVQSVAAEDAVPNALPAARGSTRNATALMIVGGAAFIAGAIIGDTAGTIIMVGGAGVGLYGLYLYLQ